MPRATKVVILGEDNSHVSFARGFISQYQFPYPKVDAKHAPPGKGDAKQFVKDAFAEECALVSRLNVNAYLIVIIDGDDLNNSQRVAWLKGNKTIPDFAKIIVPCKEIEDWITAIFHLKPPTNQGYKRTAAQRSYQCGVHVAQMCRTGGTVPEQVKPYCDYLKQVISSL